MTRVYSKTNPPRSSERGFSLIELIIVLLVMMIIMVFASRFTNTTLYKADRQANIVTDVLKEAKHRAITQQETMRVEINREKRYVRLIAENNAGDGSDDREVRRHPLADAQDVIFEKAPNNMDAPPDEPTPVPEPNFKTPVTQEVEDQNDKIATYRFLKNGNVVDAGFNSVGDGAVITGATIYFWTPMRNPNNTLSESAQVLRAITLIGSSGATRFWRCEVINGRCKKWEK
ncbi:MAG: prepilin-type N-terminal cleavage/methylation domain-containing protein [Pyrinomonadaceae bacterium]